MSTLNDLVEMESDEAEIIAEILPADARLSFGGAVSGLVGAFARAAAVSPTREVIPGTGHALLEVVAGTSSRAAHLRLTAADGDQTVSVVLDQVVVHMEGAALVPAKRVHEILKLAPVSTAKLEIIGQSLTIRSGRALWTVAVPVGEDISRVDVSRIQKQPVSAVELARALASARVAASNTPARVSLMQVQIRNGTVTACDGGRLHRVTVDALPHDIAVTIPVKSVDEIIRALRLAGDEMVYLGYDHDHVVMEIGQDVIVAQRLLIPFPEIESLILGSSFDNDLLLTVPRTGLIDAAKRVRVNSDPDSAAISLNIMPGQGSSDVDPTWVLAVQSRDRAGNASKEAMLCHWSGTRARAVTLNHRYLIEMLELVPEETVTLKLGADAKTSKSPILIEGPEFLGVIQQMAVAL